MAKLATAIGLGPIAFGLVGSTPTLGTLITVNNTHKVGPKFHDRENLDQLLSVK